MEWVEAAAFMPGLSDFLRASGYRMLDFMSLLWLDPTGLFRFGVISTVTLGRFMSRYNFPTMENFDERTI